MAAALAGLGAAAVWLGAGGLAGGPAHLAPAGTGAHDRATAVAGATRSRVTAAYGRLPLAFETNRGQQPTAVRFLARAGARATCRRRRCGCASRDPPAPHRSPGSSGSPGP